MKKEPIAIRERTAVGSFRYAILSDRDPDRLHLRKSSSRFSDNFGVQIASSGKILSGYYERIRDFLVIFDAPPSE